MEYRFLGRTGVRVSRLCLGTMAFGGDASEASSRAMFQVTLFDCADVYAGGRSEELLGRMVAEAGCRDRVVLTTKAYFPTGDGQNDRGTSRYHLVRAVEASLRRLGTDRVDVLFLHRWDDATDLEETLRALDDLVRAGKVLYPAVSNFAAWQTAKALGMADRRGFAPVVAVQPMYNLVKRQAEAEILPMARAERLAVLTYSPLGGGLLSGKYGATRRPDAGRLLDNPMYATRYGDPGVYEVAERFSTLASEAGLHPATLAIAWVAGRPGVTAPILGARTLEQLAPQLAAAVTALDPELEAAVTALWPSPPPATDRNEETSAHNYGTR